MGAIQEDITQFSFDDLGPILSLGSGPVLTGQDRRKSIEILREQHFTPSQKTVVLNKLQLGDFNVLSLVGQGGYGKVKRVSVIFPNLRSNYSTLIKGTH
jgi:hypothetical protein